MTDAALEEYLNAAEEAARAGGRILRDWEGRFGVRAKGVADLVTDADLDSQRTIREMLLSRFSDHGFLGEEDQATQQHGQCEFRWIVDPLDGTTNYVHHCPFYSVSIGLEHNGELIVGVVFDPVSGECFRAARGQGAWLGSRRLQVSANETLGDALVVTSFPPGVERDDEQVRNFLNVLERGQSVRRTGSAALNLAYVAAGRFDAFWATSMHAWDVAGGILLLTEAGGRCTDFAGNPFDVANPRMLTSNGTALHDEIQALLVEPR